MSASDQFPPPLLLGVDTGGTFTDAVLLDADELVVTNSAKALTTPDDLAVGVSNALAAVMDDVDAAAVRLVSISTTLATNAVVEGQGGAVLAILVGFDQAMIERAGIANAFPDAVVAQLAGGHDHYGNEAAPLDVEAVDALLDRHAHEVSAVAVAAAFAVRNPAHEHQIRDRVLARTDLPVTISSALSDSLDAPRRALTTALNARLLGRIRDLIDAVDLSVSELHIDAPILVAKGDGSLAVASDVARRPIETVLSGPAASIVGAATLSNLDNFILSDVGGTTTDVGRLADGSPRLVDDGAKVGGWRTMVEAIDVRTTGLGGDSAVTTDKTAITLGPRRRIPLSLLAHEHPDIVGTLTSQLADPPPRDSAGVFLLSRPKLVDGYASRSKLETRLLDSLPAGSPRALADVAPGAVERRALDQLVGSGLVAVAGFTPSDAAHVLGQQNIWDTAGATAGAALWGWYTGDDPDAFARRVQSEMVRRSAACVLEVSLDTDAIDVFDNPILDAVISGTGHLGVVDVELSTETPLIAVGGPAGVFYPDVAERIGAPLVLPVGYAVANAVGAAAGKIVVRSRVEVQGDGPGSYRVVSSKGTQRVDDAVSAIEDATQTARDIAMEGLAVRSRGIGEIGDPIERVDIVRHDDPNANEDEGLYGAVITLELRAQPFR